MLTVRTLATAIFSGSGAPLISINALSIMAGGPTGISIIPNQSMGSLPSRLVFFTKNETVRIAILFSHQLARTYL